MTLEDYMVHYGPPYAAAQVPPPICPHCGSHRTEVVGRTDTPPAIVVRCNACGERSVVSIQDNSAPAHSAADTGAQTPGSTVIL